MNTPPERRAELEKHRIPFGVYQSVGKRVVPLLFSRGYADLFAFDSLEDCYEFMKEDVYVNTHPQDVSKFQEAVYHFAREESDLNLVYRTRTRNNGEYLIIHAQGEHVWVDGCRLALVWYVKEGIYTSEMEEQQTELDKSFNEVLRESDLINKKRYDDLTGLPNMTWFFHLAEVGRSRLERGGSQTAFLFFDLNGMKDYNIQYGFEEGNQLIRAMGRLLAMHFGSDNCARFGQDHFTVFADAEGIQERVLEFLGDCRDLNGGRNLPVRAGIYVTEEGERLEISAACDRAKMACDTHRTSHRSVFEFFNRSMLQESMRRRYILDHLDQALAEGWIRVFYQPIVRTANGRVCDEEALARWFDPELGVLSPAEFIPVLEDAMLQYRLDLYVVDQVLEKMRVHREKGLYVVPVSVNLSRSDFDVCDMVEEIHSRVRKAGEDPVQISIEITESVIGSDFEYMKEKIKQFRDLGFRVWMDDFGSGYSSLDVLQSIPFDLIKFDMRFMQQFDNTDKSRIILTELMKMCLYLGIDTVCEGVEREEQLDFLREIGCTKIQGFYFGRPIPMETILERYQRGLQIGLENPEEADYYSAIGGINLYDPKVVTNAENSAYRQYFDTVPMAILELKGEEVAIVRSNRTYRSFMYDMFGIDLQGKRVNYTRLLAQPGGVFLNRLIQCARDGKQAVLSEEVTPGKSVHTFLRRVAANPVTGTTALAVVVLEIVS